MFINFQGLTDGMKGGRPGVQNATSSCGFNFFLFDYYYEFMRSRG